MNYETYYNSKDNNLYLDYLNNYNIVNNNEKYIKYQNNEKNVINPNVIQNNNNISNGTINKNNISYNNKNNFNNQKADYLIYKSVLRDTKHNSSNISNNNTLKNNNDEYLYKNYNNIKKDKYVNNIKIKNNRNDYNNYISKNYNQKLQSQSISKYNSHKVNNSNINKYNVINNKSMNRKQNRKSMQFYSSTDSFYHKNYNNKQKSQKFTKDNISNYKAKNYNNLEIKNDVINNNNEELIDKSEFFKNVKEIHGLDSIEIDSTHIGMENNNTSANLNDNFFTKENTNENDINIIDEPFINSNNNTLKKYNKTPNNINLNSEKINNLYSDKADKHLSYNRMNLKNKINKKNNKVLYSRINTEKKQNIKISKKASEKIISNLTDDKRNNFINNIDFPESFSNSNIKRENLNNFYNYEKEENNFDISENFNAYQELIINNKEDNNNNILEKKFSDKLNISPYTKKKYSTLTNNELDLDENSLKNYKENEIRENNIINEKNYDDLYNNLIKLKKSNNSLKNKIQTLIKEICKKDLLIKRLYLENDSNKKKIKKLISDNQVKLNINNKLLFQINNLNNQLISLKNGDEKNNSNKVFKDNNDNIYIKEIKDLKEKLNNYQIENNRLKKSMLMKNKEQEISKDLFKKKIKKVKDNHSEINYREYNKSVSNSKYKNKINLDIPISKSYEEDKDIKSVDEKAMNIKVIK